MHTLSYKRLPKGASIKERFDQKWVPEPFSGCWLWIGAQRVKGYGGFNVGRKCYFAHRFAFELYKGPIPEGKSVLHDCDVRLCVNPSHLHPGTNFDNMREARDRNRLSDRSGEKNASAKITESQVREILSSIAPLRVIAKQFNLSISHVGGIRTGKKWTHIKR